MMTVEPHGHSPWHPHVRPEWGDIPPTPQLLHHRAAHGQRPWRNGGVAPTGVRRAAAAGLVTRWACALALCAAATVPGVFAETGGSLEPFTYDPAGHRDQFIPLVRDGRMVGSVTGKLASALDQPVLYGILWEPGGQSIALINDLETKVGDAVGGYQVKEIRRDAVVLVNGGEPVVLSISFDDPGELPPGDTRGGDNP